MECCACMNAGVCVSIGRRRVVRGKRTLTASSLRTSKLFFSFMSLTNSGSCFRLTAPVSLALLRFGAGLGVSADSPRAARSAAASASACARRAASAAPLRCGILSGSLGTAVGVDGAEGAGAGDGSGSGSSGVGARSAEASGKSMSSASSSSAARPANRPAHAPAYVESAGSAMLLASRPGPEMVPRCATQETHQQQPICVLYMRIHSLLALPAFS